MTGDRDNVRGGRPSLHTATSRSGEVANPHKRVDLTGRERQLRGAMQAMAHVAQRFARSARQTLPFLIKRRARLSPGAVSIVDLGSDSTVERGPIYELIFEAPDGPAWALLTLNAEALGLVLEGALGGGDGSGSSGLGPALTLAQTALVGRVSRALGQDFARAIKDEVGIAMTIALAHGVATGDEREARFADGLSVECVFDGIETEGRISIAIGAEALESAARENDVPEVQSGDPRMAEALSDVPVEVVAELGSVRLGLRRVLTLEPGQVIRLETGLDDPVVVRVGGIRKFVGVPVISRGQLSVEIRSRHED